MGAWLTIPTCQPVLWPRLRVNKEPKTVASLGGEQNSSKFGVLMGSDHCIFCKAWIRFAAKHVPGDRNQDVFLVYIALSSKSPLNCATCMTDVPDVPQPNGKFRKFQSCYIVPLVPLSTIWFYVYIAINEPVPLFAHLVQSQRDGQDVPEKAPEPFVHSAQSQRGAQDALEKAP